MTLVRKIFGKGRVRVMRIHSDGDRREVRELTIKAMVEGDFDRTFTAADNSSSVSTDTIKDVVNVVARENLALSNELFCKAVAERLLEMRQDAQADEIVVVTPSLDRDRRIGSFTALADAWRIVA